MRQGRSKRRNIKKKQGFLKTTDQPTTYHRPPTKSTDHQSTDQRPTRNLRTRNSITNLLWITDKNVIGCVMNAYDENMSKYFLIKVKIGYCKDKNENDII